MVGVAFQKERGIGLGQKILRISLLEKVIPETKDMRRSGPMLYPNIYQWEWEAYAIEVDGGADAETRPRAVQNQNVPNRLGI